MVTPTHDAVGVVIPATEEMTGELRRTLPHIAAGLRAAGLERHVLTVVFQSRSPGPPPAELLPRDATGRLEVLGTTRYSASHARNLGLARLLARPAGYLVFLDADCYPSVEFWSMVRRCLRLGLPLGRGAIGWFDGAPPPLAPPRGRRGGAGLRPCPGPAALALYHLLMTCVFRRDLLLRCRFDETLGPGGETQLKSGEDTQFLYDVLLRNRVSVIPHFPAAKVYHRRRRRDLERSLVYAEGQGALYRRLFARPMPAAMKLAALAGCGLFLGHALAHVVRGRPGAGEVLRRRLRGLSGQAPISGESTSSNRE